MANINLKNAAGESISVVDTKAGFAKAERFIRDSEDRGYAVEGDTKRVADYKTNSSHWWN